MASRDDYSSASSFTLRVTGAWPLATYPPDGDIVVGTFHVPSTVINQEPIDLMPAAQRCLPAAALATYLSIPVTRTVREAASVHG